MKGSSTALGAMFFLIISTTILFITLNVTAEYQLKFKEYLKKQEEKNRENILIGKINITGEYSEITIINKGAELANIKAIYINHILQKELKEFYIPPGSIRRLKLKGILLKEGDYIKIATERGNTISTIINTQSNG